MVFFFIFFIELILFVQYIVLKYMNCVNYVYLYCRGMDSQFIGGFLFFDKYVKDVFFFDKYVFERWEVGCFIFCDFMIFDCQKYYYLVVCLIIILRVNCLKFINFYNFFFCIISLSLQICFSFLFDFLVCFLFYGGFY